MKKICGVYQIRNKINGHLYIGSSIDVKARWLEHQNKNRKGNTHLKNAFNKYGVENFSFDVLIECKPDELLAYEQKYIDNVKPNYNVSHIAGRVEVTEEIVAGRKERALKWRLTPEQRKRQADTIRGRKHSPEHVEKNRIAQTGRTHTVSKEARERISKARRGMKFSAEHIANLVKSHIGNRLSEEAKKKCSEASKRWWNAKHAEEGEK